MCGYRQLDRASDGIALLPQALPSSNGMILPRAHYAQSSESGSTFGFFQIPIVGLPSAPSKLAGYHSTTDSPSPLPPRPWLVRPLRRRRAGHSAALAPTVEGWYLTSFEARVSPVSCAIPSSLYIHAISNFVDRSVSVISPTLLTSSSTFNNHLQYLIHHPFTTRSTHGLVHSTVCDLQTTFGAFAGSKDDLGHRNRR